jgi:hypothetical protein
MAAVARPVQVKGSICMSSMLPPDRNEDHVRRVKAVMRALHMWSQRLAEPDAHILTNALLNLAVQRLLTEVSRDAAVQILSRLTGAVSVNDAAPSSHAPLDLAHLNS